jgi:hypothetical protein
MRSRSAWPISSVRRLAASTPCFIIPTRVPDSLALNKSCVVISVATPAELKVRISAEKSFAALGSRPDVGSSNNSASAFFAIAIAIEIKIRVAVGFPFNFLHSRHHPFKRCTQ